MAGLVELKDDFDIAVESPETDFNKYSLMRAEERWGDGDGVFTCADNCPLTANAGQEDADADGRGDVCDSCPADADDDLDTDGVCGDIDNCPFIPNPGQEEGFVPTALSTTADGAFSVFAVDLDGDGLHEVVLPVLDENSAPIFTSDPIAAAGATGMQAMGAVMGKLKPQLAGRADMGAVSQLVKARLAS